MLVDIIQMDSFSFHIHIWFRGYYVSKSIPFLWINYFIIIIIIIIIKGICMKHNLIILHHIKMKSIEYDKRAIVRSW